MIKDYDVDVQKLYLECLMADGESFVRCQSIFDPTLFDRKLQPAAEFLADYVKNYNCLPDYNMVNSTCKTSLKPPAELKDGQVEWLMDEFEQFVRHKSLERAIIASAELLAKHNYGEVETLIKEAVQIGLARDMGTNYYEDPKGRLEGMKNRNGQMSTGWKALDQKLYGGMSRGELNIFAGGSGAGKSLFLANLSINFSLAGYNVVYLTLELSEALVGMRMDSMLTGVPTKELFKDLDNVETKVKVIGKKSGMLQIKYIPSGKTANDIRSYLKEFEIKTNKKVDVLIIDYMDLLMPIGKKISAENLFVKDKYVSEELRNLAMEKGVIAITAAQLNRSSVEEVEFDHSHISGGLSKIQTADNVFGIFISRALRERGRYQLQLLKTRSSSGVGSKIDLGFDIDSLKIFDIEEEEHESNNGNNRGTSSVLDSIRRKTDTMTNTTVSPSDMPATRSAETPVVKATVGSSKIKAILNDLDNF